MGARGAGDGGAEGGRPTPRGKRRKPLMLWITSSRTCASRAENGREQRESARGIEGERERERERDSGRREREKGRV
eukprot:246566-Rhodomonas_salina.1